MQESNTSCAHSTRVAAKRGPRRARRHDVLDAAIHQLAIARWRVRADDLYLAIGALCGRSSDHRVRQAPFIWARVRAAPSGQDRAAAADIVQACACGFSSVTPAGTEIAEYKAGSLAGGSRGASRIAMAAHRKHRERRIDDLVIRGKLVQPGHRLLGCSSAASSRRLRPRSRARSA